jgi:hypothetical protein
MAAAGWGEVSSALAGTMRLARGDRSGLAAFDRSLAGFWRSFRAALLAYPFYLIVLRMQVGIAEWQRAGGRILVVETIAYVIAWTAFPLVMLEVARWLGREDRFFDFMVPYNWCQLPQSFLSLVIGIAAESRLLAPAANEAIGLAAAVAIFVYEWFIARVALDTTRAAAALVVLVDFLLAVSVTRIAASLY